MKKLTLILAVVMVLSMIAVLPTSAATISNDGVVLKGTPVIDGFYDEIYGQSANFHYDEDDIGVVYDTFGDDPHHDAMANFLWDDNYFYMLISVQDDDVVSSGKEYIEAEDNPWQNDAVECWFYLDDSYICKVHNDAFGYTMFCFAQGSVGSPEVLFNCDASKYAVQTTSSGYTIEVAFKLADEFAGLIAGGKEMGFYIQLNDTQDEAHETICCSGGQDAKAAETIFKFSTEEVVAPVVEEAPAAEVEDAAAAAFAAEAAPAVTVAPTTADAGIVAAVAVMAIAAGVVLSKKH